MTTTNIPEEEQEILDQLSVIKYWADRLFPSSSIDHAINEDSAYSIWLLRVYSSCAGVLLDGLGIPGTLHSGSINTLSVKDYFRNSDFPCPIDRFLVNLKTLLQHNTLHRYELHDVRTIIEALIEFLIMEKESRDEF